MTVTTGWSQSGMWRSLEQELEALKAALVEAQARIRELEELLTRDLNAELVDQQQADRERIAELEARPAELRRALDLVLWMAEEWYEHNGSEATMAGEYRRDLDEVQRIYEEATP